MIDWVIKNIWLILFFAWGLPLGFYRSKFRKLVYETDSWTINIKPVFIKEIRGLFGNIFPNNPSYRKFRNFYRFYLIIYTLLFAVYIIFNQNNKDMKKVEVGSTIPEFTLKNQFGNDFQISELIGKKNMVVYFYPKDDTPGCTKEACSFQDMYEDFKAANAEVIGISGQSVESHKAFADKYNLSFTLLADEGNKIRKMFGVPASFFGLLPGRVTYIVNKSGEVIYTFNSQMNAEKHVTEAIRVLKKSS
jgi:peroxiredoxin Q/BCP